MEVMDVFANIIQRLSNFAFTLQLWDVLDILVVA